MNYLAHLLLSGDNEPLLVGNFIADGMRGTKLSDYPSDIQAGIFLHRIIDEYTDAHPMWRQSKSYFFTSYSHYAGVLVDMFYDHLLAVHWSRFSSESLQDFSDKCYAILENNQAILPYKSLRFFKYLKRDNVLYNYQFEDQFQQTLSNLSSRTANDYSLEKSMKEFRDNRNNLEQEFFIFFPELAKHVQEVIDRGRLT